MRLREEFKDFMRDVLPAAVSIIFVCSMMVMCATNAHAQTPDVTFYTDTGSNFGDTGFTMPHDPTGAVPGTYGEIIAFPYYYAPLNPGDTLSLSYVNLTGSNYINSGGGRGAISRHHTGHIVATPALYTVTPVIVFTANVAADGSGPFYAVSGTAYNVGDPVQYDPSGDYIDQNGNSIVSYGYTTVGTVGSPINTCGQTFYVNNPDGSYQIQLPGCTLGYQGNVVDAFHETGFTQYGTPTPAVDVNGLPVVFTCTHNVSTGIPFAYKDRVLDICTLGTQQVDGSVTNGALLPAAEYWAVLPYDTACSTTGTVLCSDINPNTKAYYGMSGDAIIYSRTALGGVTRAAPPPCNSGCDDGVQPSGRRI